MFCESCGKKLIRGYQFCLECGTPVPPEEEDAKPEVVEQEEAPAEDPRVQPLNGGEGTLIFCPNCGMRMQTSTTVCEKCGQPLTAGAPSGVPAGMPTGIQSGISIGSEAASLSPSEIDSLNSFGNGGLGGVGGIGGLDGNSLEEIEKLTNQLQQLSSTASEMPAIGGNHHSAAPAPRKQPTLVPMGEPDPLMANSAANQPTNDVPVITPKPVRRDNSDSTLGEAVPVLESISMNAPAGLVDLPLENDPTRVMSFDIEKTPDAVIADPTADALAMPFDVKPVEPIPKAEPVIPFYELPDPVKPAPVEAPIEPAAIFEEPAPAAPVEPAAIFEEPAPAAPVPEPAPIFDEPAPVAPVPEPAPVFDEPAPVAPVPEPAPVFDEPAPVAETPAEPVFTETAPAAEVPAADVDPADLFGNGEHSEPERKPTSSIDSYTPAPAYNDPYDSPEWDIKPDKSYRPHDYVEEDDKTEETAPVGPDLGKLVYCRNCGQDMYEKEEFCKNCGSPNVWNKKPLKHQVSSAKNGNAPAQEKKPIKVFGVIPLPTAIIAAVAVIGIIVLVATTQNTGNNPVPVSNTTSSTTSSQPTESQPSDTSSDANGVGAESDVTTTQPTQPTESTPSDVSEPIESDPVESNPGESDPVESNSVDSEPEDTTASSRPVESEPTESTGTTSHSTTTATTRTTTTRATTTRATTTRSTTTTKPVVTAPTATVKSQNSDRDKILSAVEKMAGEIGKIQVLATSAIDAVNEDSRGADTALTSYYNREYCTNMISVIKGGKSGVDSAYTSAKPKNSVFNDAYKSLGTLYNAYKAYYDYVISPGKGSAYESKCSSLLNSFTTAAKSLKLSNLKTSDQTSSDETQMFLDTISSAGTAATNSVNQYSSLRKKIADLKSSTYETEVVELLNKSTNQKAYMNAAMYGFIVQIYSDCIIDKAPSGYSTQKSYLGTIGTELDNLFTEIENAEYNSLSGFKTNTQSSIDTVNSAVKKIG